VRGTGGNTDHSGGLIADAEIRLKCRIRRLLGVVGTIMGLIGIVVIGDIASGKGWGVIVGLIGIIAIGDIGSDKSWGTIVGLIGTIVIGDIGSGKSWGVFVPDMIHILPTYR
jgi:hypothetical protein